MFYYKVSGSKVTNDQKRSVTECKCDAQSRPFWHHPWDAYSQLRVETYYTKTSATRMQIISCTRTYYGVTVSKAYIVNIKTQGYDADAGAGHVA